MLSVMKKQTRTIIIVLLNVLFCAALLWFFSRNAFIRPYAGSAIKEMLIGGILLASIYANYFLLYPKLYLNGYLGRKNRSLSPSSPSTLTRLPDRLPFTSSPPRDWRA